MGVTVRTPEIDEALIEGITNGIPLRELCRNMGIGKSTVYDWIDEDPEFAGRIARARDRGFDEIAEECLEIANSPVEGTETEVDADGNVVKEKRGDMLGHRKLQIETRLKLLAKWSPSKYGDRTAVALSTPDGPLRTRAESADLSRLTDEELAALESISTKLGGNQAGAS